MATGFLCVHFRAGALIAAAMLLSTHAFAIGDRETVTINSDKHNTKPPGISPMPPTNIPAAQPPAMRIDPVNADASIGPRTSGGSASQPGIQVNSNTRVGHATRVDTIVPPPTITGGTSGR